MASGTMDALKKLTSTRITEFNQLPVHAILFHNVYLSHVVNVCLEKVFGQSRLTSNVTKRLDNRGDKVLSICRNAFHTSTGPNKLALMSVNVWRHTMVERRYLESHVTKGLNSRGDKVLSICGNAFHTGQ